MATQNLDDLLDVIWTPITGTSFIMKYKFCDKGYNALTSDLTYIYGEKLNEMDIHEKFRSLNPYAEIKGEVVMKKLQQSLECFLESKENIEDAFLVDPNKVKLKLQFVIAEISFVYEMEMLVLPAEQMRIHLLAPAIRFAQINYQKVTEMQKNMEIQKGQRRMVPLKASSGTLKKQKNINESTEYEDDPIKSLLKSFISMQGAMMDMIKKEQEHIRKLQAKKCTMSSVSATQSSSNSRIPVFSPSVKRETSGNGSEAKRHSPEKKTDTLQKKEDSKPTVYVQQQLPVKIRKKKAFNI